MNDFSFEIGQKVFMTKYDREARAVTCPDCDGSTKVKVTLGNGTEIMIDCGGCDPGGYQPSTGFITQYAYLVTVITRTVTGVKKSLTGIEYELDNFGDSSYYTGSNETCFADEEAAKAKGEELKSIHESEENSRLMAKTKDHKSWAFNYSYHLRCAKEAEKTALYHRSKAQICQAKSKTNE